MNLKKSGFAEFFKIFAAPLHHHSTSIPFTAVIAGKHTLTHSHELNPVIVSSLTAENAYLPNFHMTGGNYNRETGRTAILTTPFTDVV